MPVTRPKRATFGAQSKRATFGAQSTAINTLFGGSSREQNRGPPRTSLSTVWFINHLLSTLSSMRHLQLKSVASLLGALYIVGFSFLNLKGLTVNLYDDDSDGDGHVRVLLREDGESSVRKTRVTGLYYAIPNQSDGYLKRYIERQVNTSDSSASYNPLENCSPTTQVILIPDHDGSSSRWTLQALDDDGNKKTTGGDEFYVEYQDESDLGMVNEPTAVAVVSDQLDGTYTLDFFTPPSRTQPVSSLSKGKITVHFVFTCGIGNAYQPTKDTWRTGGGTKVSHSTIVAEAPPVQPFEPPNQNKSVNLNSYNTTFVFGDSLLRQLVRYNGTQFFDSRLRFISFQMDLSSKTVGQWLRPIRNRLRAELGIPNTALIVGSAAWDVLLQKHPQGAGFDNHIGACRTYVETLRQDYPNSTVIWRLPSDLHFHNVNRKCLDQGDSTDMGYTAQFGNIPCKCCRRLHEQRLRSYFTL